MARTEDKKACDDVVVVMVPLPAQGHLNQLLHLSHILSSHGLTVHFVSTPTHNRQALLRLQGWHPAATSRLHFHHYSVPFAAPPPDPNTSNKLPVQLFPSFSATVNLRQPVSALLEKLSAESRRVVVIHDSLMFYVVQDVVCLANVESYCFHSISAFSLYVDYWEKAGKPVVLPDGVPINDVLVRGAGMLFPRELTEFIMLQRDAKKSNSGNLYNTSRLIEGDYVNSLARENYCSSENHWAIGPLNPLIIHGQGKSSVKCLEWLDKQKPDSVLFVSFGSTTSLSEEQVEEIAIGLDNSGQKFIWVVRDADRGDIFAEESRRIGLPEWFEERMVKEGKGLVVREWAPQLEILQHPSTGGFMSHCGWNSCMESVGLGVPFAAWPMHSDQLINAVLMTRILRLGLMVGEWGREGELVKADAVETAATKLMDSTGGDEIRKRVLELSHAIKESGVTDIDTFLAHIRR